MYLYYEYGLIYPKDGHNSKATLIQDITNGTFNLNLQVQLLQGTTSKRFQNFSNIQMILTFIQYQLHNRTKTKSRYR